MRYAVLVMLFLGLCACTPEAEVADSVAKEEEAVKKLILDTYIRGGHQEWDAGKMERGFHPDFSLPMLQDGELSQLPIGEWLDSLEKRKKENPDGPDYEVTHEFTFVDVVGTAALARLELYRDGKHIFTDYLSLYRFPDGWKIVGKIYYRYP